MSSALDFLKVAVAVFIAAILISLAVYLVNSGLDRFNQSTEAIQESIDNSNDVKNAFNEKTMSGKTIIMYYHQLGDDYKFMVQTSWMAQERIAPYQYGGDDAIVSKQMYRDRASRFYFNEDAMYTSSLIYDGSDLVGFRFTQIRE